MFLIFFYLSKSSKFSFSVIIAFLFSSSSYSSSFLLSVSLIPFSSSSSSYFRLILLTLSFPLSFPFLNLILPFFHSVPSSFSLHFFFIFLLSYFGVFLSHSLSCFPIPPLTSNLFSIFLCLIYLFFKICFYYIFIKLFLLFPFLYPPTSYLPDFIRFLLLQPPLPRLWVHILIFSPSSVEHILLLQAQ